MRIGIWCFSSCLRHTPTLPEEQLSTKLRKFPNLHSNIEHSQLIHFLSTKEQLRSPKKSKSVKLSTILFPPFLVSLEKEIFRRGRFFRRCEIPFQVGTCIICLCIFPKYRPHSYLIVQNTQIPNISTTLCHQSKANQLTKMCSHALPNPT